MFNSKQIPIMPNYAPADVKKACCSWGVHLWVPAGLNGAQVLRALSGCETSFGANCPPRHEMAYCTGVYSKNAQVERLTSAIGCAAHCSYGPWQLLLINCSDGTAPADMQRLDRAAMETVAFINRRILQGEKAQTVRQIAMAYNSGKWNWIDAKTGKDETPEGAVRYADDCERYYNAGASC